MSHGPKMPVSASLANSQNGNPNNIEMAPGGVEVSSAGVELAPKRLANDELDLVTQTLAAALTSAISNGDKERTLAAVYEIRAKAPFLYCLLSDTMNAAIARANEGRSMDYFANIVNVRVQSLRNWHQEGNETVAAINRREIDADAIKPHIRQESAAYDKFYADQSAKIASRAAYVSEKDYDAVGSVCLPTNINHAFRWAHAISIVEAVLGVANLLSGAEQTIRWMDIGCGTGNFANNVNPRRFGVQAWDIVGCDLQEGKIEVAERRKARGRSFFAADAYDMLDKYKVRGESFHLVSMFEFLEHLDDPLRFVRQLETFSPKFVLAASPLEQKLKRPRDVDPDRVHFWSFSRKGWQQMFEIAGFEVVYTSEVRIGSYIGGLDWLSVLCGPRSELSARRQELGKS